MNLYEQIAQLTKRGEVHWGFGRSSFETQPDSLTYPFYAIVGEPGKSVIFRSDTGVEEAMEEALGFLTKQEVAMEEALKKATTDGTVAL